MKSMKYLRVIKSVDKEYVLMPDEMFTTTLKTITESDQTYQMYQLYVPSLSRASVRRVLKQMTKTPQYQVNGRIGKEKYSYTGVLGESGGRIENHKLTIGCQTFNHAAVMALLRWTGVGS